MPVIRYRTRDLTHLMPGINRNMRRIGKITGRSDDMMIIRGVNVFPSQIEEQIMQFKELSPHYQLEISRKGNMDSLAIRVELKKPNLLTYDERCNICHNLKHRIKSMVGVSTQSVSLIAVISLVHKAKRLVLLIQGSPYKSSLRGTLQWINVGVPLILVS